MGGFLSHSFGFATLWFIKVRDSYKRKSFQSRTVHWQPSLVYIAVKTSFEV